MACSMSDQDRDHASQPLYAHFGQVRQAARRDAGEAAPLPKPARGQQKTS
jgi:hypothetical protein